MVSGILLILSIFNFALAAPLLVKEKRQTYVDAVMLNIPKDEITVLGKRGEQEEFEKLVENYFKSVKPTQSSETHAASGSAPPGPDHASTSAVQAPEPNPASSTANPDPLMGPSSPALELIYPPGYESGHELSGAVAPEVNPNPMQSTGHFDWNNLLNKDYPPQSTGYFDPNNLLNKDHPPQSIGHFDWNNLLLNKYLSPGPARLSSSEEVGQYLDAQPLAEQPLSAAPMHPGTSADPVLDWKHLTNVDFKPKPEAPKKSGQQTGQDPMLPDKIVPLKQKPTDEFGSQYWSSTSLGDLLPKLEPPKDVGKAHESQLGQPEELAGAHAPSSSAGAESDQGSSNIAQAPELNPASPDVELIYPPGSSRYEPAHELLGPSNAGPSNLPSMTTLDSSTGLGVNRPLPPPTDSERATMGYRPPSPPAELDPDLWLSPLLTPTEADSFRYPGSAVHPPSPGAGLSTIPEHEVGTPPPPPPKGPDGL